MSRRVARRKLRLMNSTAWVPTDISGIKFWVKADAGTTTLGDAGITTPYTSWTQVAATITGGQTSHDGSTNAYSITDTGANTWHYTQSSMTYSAGSLYKIECYAKYGSRQYLCLAFDSLLKWFDIQNGTVGSSSGTIVHSSIVSVGSGWYKCTMYAYAGSTNCYIFPANSDGGTNYAGSADVACYVADITVTRVAVSAWADQSLTGDSNKNLAQATLGSRPGLISVDSGYNNYPTIYFGANDNMASGTWSSSLAQPSTHYFVGAAPASGTDPIATDGIAAGNRQSLSSYITSGLWTMYAGSAAVSAPATTTVAKHVVCASFAGVSSAMYIDAYSSSVVSATPGTHTLTGVTVGSRYDSSYFWNGKIAELIIYSGTHTEEQRRVVMQYLGTKYGITIS